MIMVYNACERCLFCNHNRRRHAKHLAVAGPFFDRRRRCLRLLICSAVGLAGYNTRHDNIYVYLIMQCNMTYLRRRHNATRTQSNNRKAHRPHLLFLLHRYPVWVIFHYTYRRAESFSPSKIRRSFLDAR